VQSAITVGEEGAGDLRGAKYLFARLERMPAARIAIDGAGDDRIVHRALGARRFRITFQGERGHSWAAFGASTRFATGDRHRRRGAWRRRAYSRRVVRQHRWTVVRALTVIVAAASC